jgi:hypothetical protein
MSEGNTIDSFMLDEIRPKKDCMVNRDLESDIFKNLSKEVFSTEMEKMGFDLMLVANGRRNKNEHFHKFNIFIKMMNSEKKFSIHDMALYLEEDYFDMKTVANCFNEENLYILREEMTLKYNIKQKKTRLTLIIEE